MKKITLATATALLALTACSDADFIATAQGEGITVHHPDLARGTVADLCRNLDKNPNPMAAMFASAGQHMSDPTLSTNDERLVQLGIEARCAEHRDVLAGLRAAFTEPAAPQAVPAPPIELAFGETHTYPDGIALTVSQPVRYEIPTDNDPYGGDGIYFVPEVDGTENILQVRVTVKNGTPAEVNPSSFTGSATLNGQPIAGLYADGGDVVRSGHTLLPEQSQTFDELFLVPGPGDLVITYQTATGEPVHYRLAVTDTLLAAQDAVTSEPLEEQASCNIGYISEGGECVPDPNDGTDIGVEDPCLEVQIGPDCSAYVDENGNGVDDYYEGYYSPPNYLGPNENTTEDGYGSDWTRDQACAAEGIAPEDC